MKKIYPTQFRQENNFFCLPACLQAIIFYHSNRIIDQIDLFNMMERNPSFGSASLINITDFEFYVNYPNSFEEWLGIIINELKMENPVAISTRISENQVHIRVVIGFNNESLTLHNPGTWEKENIVPIVENYSFLEAKKDWERINKCGDLLLSKYTPTT